MKTQNRHSPPGSYRKYSIVQKVVEFFHLLIHNNPESLESPCRCVNSSVTGARWDRAHNQIRKFRSRLGQSLLSPRVHNRTSNATRKPLLAEFMNDIRKL